MNRPCSEKLSRRERFAHLVARCCVDCRRFLACCCLYYICFVVKLHHAIVLCGAERVRTISHESFQCLCFERRSQSRSLSEVAQNTLLHGRNSGYSALPASGRGGSAHRLRSGRLRPRAADRRPVLGIGAVSPPAAPAGCQSPVSGTGLDTRRLVREALPTCTLAPMPCCLHATNTARNASPYRGILPVGKVVPLKPPTPPWRLCITICPPRLRFWSIFDRPWS